METDWAVENLQTIRTLMERAAVYRHTLAPIMILTGMLGLGAALVGWVGDCNTDRTFVLCWLCAGLAGTASAFFLVRRQALKESEPFWTPPVRRIIAAVAPSWFVALFLSGLFLIGNQGSFAPVILPSFWMILYGISLQAAGFFMPRGIKLLGWIFLLLGCAYFAVIMNLSAAALPEAWRSFLLSGHFAMGLFFGGLHLAYGLYLVFTENRRNAA